MSNFTLGVRSVAKCVRFVSGELVALSGDRRGVCSIPVERNCEIETVHRHEKSVTAVASGSGGLVVSAGFDGRVRIIARRGNPHLQPQRGRLQCGGLSQWALRASSDSKGRLKVWSRDARRVVGEWTDHRRPVFGGLEPARRRAGDR